MGFEPDERIQQVAAAYAEDAIDVARDEFRLTLDWSDESIQHVETILGSLHSQIPAAKPSDEKVFGFAKALGSYVGEVFRRNHGAVWGNVTLGADTFPGLRANRTGSEFWPGQGLQQVEERTRRQCVALLLHPQGTRRERAAAEGGGPVLAATREAVVAQDVRRGLTTRCS